MIDESTFGKGFYNKQYTDAYRDAGGELSKINGLNYNQQTPDVQQVLRQVYADSKCYKSADFSVGSVHFNARTQSLFMIL